MMKVTRRLQCIVLTSRRFSVIAIFIPNYAYSIALYHNDLPLRHHVKIA